MTQSPARGKRAKLNGDAPGLYEQEQADLDLAQEEADLDAIAAPPPVEPEYLETDDEDELRTIISNLDDMVEVLLAIPEWVVKGKDGKDRVVRVLIRSLESGERAEFLQMMQKTNFDMKKMYTDLAILTVRHPRTKNLLFKAADRGMLNKKMGRAIERMAMKSADISGLSEKALEEMKKN